MLKYLLAVVSTGGAGSGQEVFSGPGAGKRESAFSLRRKNSRIKPGEKQPGPEEEKRRE